VIVSDPDTSSATAGQLISGLPALHAFHSGTLAFGVGVLLASLACTRLARGRSLIALLIVAVVATGAGTIINGLAPVLAVVVAAQLIAGAGNAIEKRPLGRAAVRRVPDGQQFRSRGLVSTVITVVYSSCPSRRPEPVAGLSRRGPGRPAPPVT
jgi:hypothetical protein